MAQVTTLFVPRISVAWSCKTGFFGGCRQMDFCEQVSKSLKQRLGFLSCDGPFYS